MKRRGSEVLWLIRALVLAVLLVQVMSYGPAHAQKNPSDEVVAFNTKTLKYHCLECTWAKKCTANCINISKGEAIRRGGVPCKVCGGSCSKTRKAA